MIYLDEKSDNRQGFENLLLHTKDTVIKQLADIEKPSTLSGSDFELIVYENSVINAKETPFDGLLRHTDDREFPDIIAAELFGVEVKATKKDDWTSIGNSVLESSRVPSVEKIYMFFGKLGGSPDIIFRNYEDCLKGIAVTHYPRYQIDMMLDESSSIFRKMGTTYDEIRNSKNPIKEIRAFYRSQLKEGDALWWIDDDMDKAVTLSPIIKNFTSLDQSVREDIKADIFVLFPEVFSSSSKKFERVPAYLAANYGVVSANLRDHFTAGGRVNITYQGKTISVPQIASELCKLAERVSNCLRDKDLETLSNFWQKKIEATSTEAAWEDEIDRHTADTMEVKMSELYHAALQGQIHF